MSTLAPNLFERRFQDLVEIGRARLPALAPDWTDHNAHDPGITLMELLAWVGEAQLFSLSRLRRDERVAYAALLGLTPAGTQGSTGLVWPDRKDSDAPARTFSKAVVIPEDAVIHTVASETPTFRPTHPLLWTPGRITSIVTRQGSGRTADHTATNERGVIPFLPFGERAGRRDVLAITFAPRDDAGFFGADRESAMGARWSLGFMAAPAAGGAQAAAVAGPHSTITAALVTRDARFPLPIVSDSTNGLLATGVLLFDVDRVPAISGPFTIELRSAAGSARPPRVLRIDPNVVPIRQGRVVTRETHEATGLPDFSFPLEAQGLRFGAGEEPITLEVSEASGLNTWRRRDRLSDGGPDDNGYELDPSKGEVTFGNGVNGRIPPGRAQVLVSYSVSDGEAGNIARNRAWRVAGFPGVFGVNPDPITGGAAPSGWIDQRREARRRSREAHALVSDADIVAAARALPLLDVARAWVVTPETAAARTGVVTLVVMRGRVDGREPEQSPETPRWLDAIRRRLAPRMPLGIRLAVRAPQYVDFSIRATLDVMPGRDPDAVTGAVQTALRERLTLVSVPGALPPRSPGVPVTRRDVGAWIRAVEGVARVNSLQLLGPGGRETEQVRVPRSGLPRWIASRSSIQAQRSGGTP